MDKDITDESEKECNSRVMRESDLYQKVTEETRTQIRGQLLINISHSRNILHVFPSRLDKIHAKEFTESGD